MSSRRAIRSILEIANSMLRTMYNLEMISLDIESEVFLKTISDKTYPNEFEEFKGGRIPPLTYMVGNFDFVATISSGTGSKENLKYVAKVNFRFYIEKDGAAKDVFHTIEQIALSRPEEKLSENIVNQLQSYATLLLEHLRLAIQVLVDRTEF
jgi:hypothetical protein